MRPIINLFLTLAALLAAFGSALAMPSFVINTPTTGTVGSTVTMELVANGFTDMEAFQFSLNIDTTKVRFMSATPLIPALDAVPAPTTATTKRYVNVVYFFPSTETYPDGTVILRFNLQVRQPNIAGAVTFGTSSFHLSPVVTALVNGVSTTFVSTISPNGLTLNNAPPGPPPAGFSIYSMSGSALPGAKDTVMFFVTGFTDVTEIIYTVNWNPNVLSFNRYIFPPFGTGIPGFDRFNVDTTSANVTAGFSPTVWPDASDPLGTSTLPDSTKIFSIVFDVVGNPGDTTSVWLDGTGAPPTTPSPFVDFSNGMRQWNAIRSLFTVATPPPPAETVTFALDKDTVFANGSTCVSVAVQDFDNVTSFELRMTYDHTRLTFTGFDSIPGPLNMSIAPSNPSLTHNATTKEIRAFWGPSPNNPRTLADGTVIFSQCFNSIGAVNSTANVRFENLGLVTNKAFVNGNVAGVNLINGHVFVNPAMPPTAVIDSSRNVSCSGGNNGAIFLTTGGAAPGLTFSWSGPNNFTSNTEDVTGLPAGTYTVTVSSTNGLSTTATRTITQPAAVALDLAQVALVNVRCFGQSNGTVTVPTTAVSGGSNPYSYVWTGPGGPYSTRNLTGLPSGTYNLIITDSKSCTGTSSVTIIQPEVLVINSASISVLGPGCAGGNTGSITINSGGVAGGTPNYTYSWTGGTLSGTVSTQNLTGLGAGTYSLTVRDANMCSASASFTINPTAGLQVNQAQVSVVQPACFGSTGSIAVSNTAVSGGVSPYSFAWTGPNGATFNSQNLSNLNPGTYNLTVSDANGCSGSGGSYVVNNAPSAIVINSSLVTTLNIRCGGSKPGEITIGNSAVTGGNGGYTYAWSGPNYSSTNRDITNLNTAGTYTVTVSDSKGCQAIANFNIVVTGSTIQVSLGTVVNESCAGSNNGSIQINISGGQTPYTVQWWNASGPTQLPGNSPLLQNIAAGTYFPLVSDAAGCGPATLPLGNVILTTTPNNIAVSAVATDVSCNGGNNGTITLNVTPASTYTASWTPTIPGGLTPTGLVAGTYKPTVTRTSDGCTVTIPAIQVNQPQAIGVQLVNKTDIKCNGAGDGTITITVTGGTAPYTVNWGSLAGTTISQLAPGNYTPTVTDAKGCTFVGTTYTITQPNALAITLVSVTDQSGTGNNGAIDISVAGGTGAYSYLWAPGGSTSQDPTGLSPGTYTVLVTDANGCTTRLENIVVRSGFAGSVVAIQGACDNDGCVTLRMVGGQAPFVYSWGSSTATSLVDSIKICGLPGGLNYNFTVTDAQNATFAFPMVNVPSLQPALHQVLATQPNDNLKNGSILLTPVFSGPFTYTWIPNIYTGKSLSNLDSGTYTVIVTNQASGCTWTESLVLVRQYEAFVVTTGGQAPQVSPKCASTCDGILRFGATGGDGPSYTWTVTGPNGFTFDTTTLAIGAIVTLRDLCFGEYTVTNKDESNNIRVLPPYLLTTQSNLVARDTLLSNFAGFGVSGSAFCDGRVRAIPTMGITPYSYAWSSGGVTTAVNGQLCAGDYAVTVTDGVGCTTVVEGVLTSPDAIIPTATLVSNYNGFGVSCNGDKNGRIRISAIGGVPPYEVYWSTSQSALIEQSNGFEEIQGLGAGVYAVTLTDANGVTSTSSIEVTEPAPMAVTFTEIKPSSFKLCDGKFSFGTIGSAGIPTFTYSVANGQGGTGNSIDELCVGQMVQVTAIDANGCRATGRDTIGYPDDGCFQISPVITPGPQDNKNNFMIITCIESAKSHKLEIFNRWGQLVFESENYSNFGNAWEGNNSAGQPLPEGVYFYVLNFVNEENMPFQIKGYIDLLR